MRLQRYGWTDVGMRPETNATICPYVKWSDVEYAAAQQQALTNDERDKIRGATVLLLMQRTSSLRLDLNISSEEWQAAFEGAICKAEDDMLRRCLIQQLPGSSPAA